MSEKSLYPLFEKILDQSGIPKLTRGYHIEIPAYLKVYQFKNLQIRNWRIDYCWPKFRLAVEIDGGAFMKGGGGHNRGAGFRRDMIRHNTLQNLGFTIYRFMPEHLPPVSMYAIDLIKKYFLSFLAKGEQMTINEIATIACKELPLKWIINVHLEKNSGYVELIAPDSNEPYEMLSTDIEDQINEAITVAKIENKNYE